MARLTAKIPKVKTVADSRKSRDFLERQLLHNVVRVIQVRGSLRWSASPVPARVRIAAALSNPIAGAGAEAVDRTRHALPTQ
jgi:hypothetical protein